MAKKRNIKPMLWGGLLGALGASLFWSLLRQGDTVEPGGVVIRGSGNSGNNFYLDPLRDKLAATIAAHPQTPAITDEQLVETFEAIRHRAREGDLPAALVLFRIAEKQRSAQEKRQAAERDS